MEKIENLKLEEIKTLLDYTDKLKNKVEFEFEHFNIAKFDKKDLACLTFICELLQNEIQDKNKDMIIRIFGGNK